MKNPMLILSGVSYLYNGWTYVKLLYRVLSNAYNGIIQSGLDSIQHSLNTSLYEQGNHGAHIVLVVATLSYCSVQWVMYCWLCNV